MPGHKGQGEFAKMFPVAGMDVTELSWSDNLSCPDGIIFAAQSDIAKILGAKKSYILTDGSSSGVLTMMYAASKRGKKIIVFRNCHKSVWNACKLFGFEPVIVQGEVKNGIMLPPPPGKIAGLIKNDSRIAGIVATSPDYYGNVPPLEEYAKILKERDRLFLIDGAHGAHLAFGERMKYAGTYADIWVDGAHKTLCTLTQGAVLNVNNESLFKDVEEGLDIFRTTSPSYPVMASVEYGVKQCANFPAVIEKARKAALEVREDKFFTVYGSDDWAKLAIDLKPFDISADKVAEELEKRGIYCEFSDGRYILFYLSPMVGADELGQLKAELKSILTDKKFYGSYRDRILVIPEARFCGFRKAMRSPYEWVEPQNAVGRTCAQSVGITPPCIPVCVTGEVITAEAIRTLECGKTFGLSDGMIKVVK